MNKNSNLRDSDHRRWSVRLLADPGSGDATPVAPWDHVERRGTAERRVVYDRRHLIRFEDDRRDVMERRGGGGSLAHS